MWAVLPAAKNTVLPRVKLSPATTFPSKEAFAAAEVKVYTNIACCE